MHALLAPVAREMRDGVMRLERIARRVRERLVHVGEERGRRQPSAIRHMDEAFGKLLRLVEARHEGARAPFHVEHQAAEARGELLREDRGGDEIDRFDRRGDVANGVKALVGRSELARLADDGAARLAHGAAKGRDPGLRAIPFDRLELVERAARMAKAAPRDHRHEAAGGGDGGREDQAHIVADAARRMLVENRARKVPAQHLARSHHGARERDALVEREALEKNRHGEGRGLAFAHLPAREAFDEARRCPPAEAASRRASPG